MNSLKTSILSISYHSPNFALIKSMACGLALLASGQAQAFATTYYSVADIGSAADFTLGSKWKTGMCTPATPMGGTITPALNKFYICDGTQLTLAVTDVVDLQNLLFDSVGTSFSGILRFSSGNKAIENYNPSLSSIALNVSSMTTGDIITIAGGGYQSVTFSSVTGGSLACPSSTYTAGVPIAEGQWH